MNDIFQLLETGIEFKWDPEELTKNFKSISSSNNTVISHPTGEACWQYYKTGISFSRNFAGKFPEVCKEVVGVLSQLQKKCLKLENKSYLINLFLEHKLTPYNIVLIKIVSGTSVGLHFDTTRSHAVNIGLKNSNTCLTHIYSGERVKNTLIDEKNIKYTFQMNDGDVYLLATCQPHYVESLTSINKNEDRYLISYCLV
jgi:hypothetical protein